MDAYHHHLISELAVNVGPVFTGCAQQVMQRKLVFGARPEIWAERLLKPPGSGPSVIQPPFFIFFMSRFIFYRNNSHAKVFVFICSAMWYAVTKGQRSIYRLNEVKPLCFGTACWTHECFRERNLACGGGAQNQGLSLVLIIKISCIWWHCSYYLFPLLLCVLHCDLYHIVCQHAE